MIPTEILSLGVLVGRTPGTGAGDLLKVSENSVSEGSYAYDAQGRRVESLESSTIFYAYMGTNTLYEDKAANRASND